MLIQCSWAIHYPEGFVSHTESLEALEGTDFSFHTLHQDLTGSFGICMAWVQHPLPRWGCLYLSSLQDRDSESWAWRGQTTVFVPHVLSWLCWIMCWNTGADIREGQALLSSTSCTRLDQGSWLQKMFQLLKVVGTFLVIFLPSSCPHANPIWADV